MKLLLLIHSPEDFQGRLPHFTLKGVGSKSGFLLWIKLGIQVNFMSPEQCLLKSGDRTKGPSPLRFLDQTECNWTYISFSRPWNAQTFFRQTEKLFPIVLDKNDSSSVPVN